MAQDIRDRVRSLVAAKALAIASYGESVAAYRYRTLAEKTPNHKHHDIFVEMAEEEQGHHTDVQEILRKDYPESDFVLNDEDKAMVIVGPRMLDVGNQAAFDCALEQIYESELCTGNFYLALHDITTNEELKPFLKEMGDECFDHAKRLKAL